MTSNFFNYEFEVINILFFKKKILEVINYL